MEMKDMLDPKQAKALAELMNKPGKAKSAVDTEVRFVPKNKMPQKNHPSKTHNNSYSSKINTSRSSNISTRKSPSVSKTNQTVDLYVIDNGAEICPIHKTHLQKKEYNLVNTINNRAAVLTITALHCTQCNKNYIEERKQSALLTQIKRGYPIRIKLYEETKQQIESRIDIYPVDIKLNTPIHILEETGAGHASVKCPIHGWDLKIYKMKRNYDKQSVGFFGYLCEHCKRVYMLRSAAEEMLYECGEIGIPRPEFVTSTGKPKDSYTAPAGQKRPKYLVYDGKKASFDINLLDQVEEWIPIEPSDEILVSYSINCDLEDHDTEAYWCSIDVLEKSGVENQYVVEMGYCSTCERFNIPVDDYNVIYQAGKAKALVTDSTGEFDFVRAGYIFDSENEHLIKLQSDADLYIDQLKEKYHYVPRYATSSDGYEDIGRLHGSKRECEGLYEDIEMISDYSSRPYTNRVDIYHGKNNIEYYIGVNDYNLPGYANIISGWSDFGKKLSNYKSLEIEQSGEKYKVKLRRQFEIIGGRLYGFQNIFSDEEKHFQDGLTDPFLVKVLRTRQRQHRLTDILLTIQEKQYEIIEQELHQNIVVQGCAGSGKTMVLLHRLSYLNYNHKGLDLSKIIILTPNANFNMHIQGLTEILSVSKIERKSIEDYYTGLLDIYNGELTGSNKKGLLREENVKTDYVNYIYSNLFLEDMDQAYDRIFSECADFEKFVVDVYHEAGIDFNLEENAPDQLRIENISKQAGKLVSAAELKEISVKRKKENIGNMGRELNEIQESILPITQKADQLILSARESIPIVIEQLIDERNAILEDSSKKNFLQRLREIGSRKEVQLERAIRELTELEVFKEIKWSTASEEQLLNTLRALRVYRDGLEKDRDILKKQLNQLKIKRVREEELKAAIELETTELERLMKESWSVDLQSRISELNDKLKEYTPSNIIKRIYESATDRERIKSKIRETRSLYKFDLYAMLHIAMRYYDKANGVHDYFCVDEGQDLSVNEYKLLQSLNGGRVVFNIFGDVNQLLKKGSGISAWEEINKELRANHFVLNENYRNTNQITRYCNENFKMGVVLTGVEGKLVKEIQRHSLETELSKINLGDERLAILVPRQVKKDQYIDHERLPEHISKIIGAVVGNGNIALMYVDEVKGMEFDAVYVVRNGMTDNEKYIAFTRALTELIVVNDIDVDSKRAVDKYDDEN